MKWDGDAAVIELRLERLALDLRAFVQAQERPEVPRGEAWAGAVLALDLVQRAAVHMRPARRR